MHHRGPAGHMPVWVSCGDKEDCENDILHNFLVPEKVESTVQIEFHIPDEPVGFCDSQTCRSSLGLLLLQLLVDSCATFANID